VNNLRRGMVSSEILVLNDSVRRIRQIVTSEEKSLQAQPDPIEFSKHTTSVRVGIVALNFAVESVENAIRNLRTVLEAENIEHIDIGDAQCSP